MSHENKHKITRLERNKAGSFVLEVLHITDDGQEISEDKVIMSPATVIGTIRTLLEYFFRNQPHIYHAWHSRAIPRHPCFFCGNRGDTGDSFFSEDWDTPVHFKCVFEQIVKHPEGTEAWGMLTDFLIICFDNIKQEDV